MKKILITYSNTGAGHVIPAIAIAERIEDLYPNQYQVIASNFFEDAGELKFNRHIEKSWDFFLKYPILAKIVDRLGRILYAIPPYFLHVMHNRVLKNSMKHIRDVNPDVVFSTHFFSHTVAIEAKKKYNLSYTIIGFNPDTFEILPQWDRRGDILVLCSELAEKRALTFGHKKDYIKLVPQPLRKEFIDIKDIDPAQLRKEYNLRPDVFTIFMSDGGQGVGNSLQTVEALLKHNLPLNIIIICGKNEKLYQKMLQYQSPDHPTQILPFQFIDSTIPFIQMSDLFIGKAGPATVYECLKLKLPVLINFHAHYAERITSEYFEGYGVAMCCLKPNQIPHMIQEMIDNPTILNDIKDKISSLDIFQDGSKIMSELIVDEVNK